MLILNHIHYTPLGVFSNDIHVLRRSLEVNLLSPPGPSVHGIFQARVLEWVAIALSMRKLRQK